MFVGILTYVMFSAVWFGQKFEESVALLPAADVVNAK